MTKPSFSMSEWEIEWNKFLDEIVSDKDRSQTFISSKHSILMTHFISDLLASQREEMVENLIKMLVREEGTIGIKEFPIEDGETITLKEVYRALESLSPDRRSKG